MAKRVFYDEDARRRVLAGAEVLYNAVKTTMGPKGRNVVISKSYGAPSVTHDGVTVAKGVDSFCVTHSELLNLRLCVAILRL